VSERRGVQGGGQPGVASQGVEGPRPGHAKHAMAGEEPSPAEKLAAHYILKLHQKLLTPPKAHRIMNLAPGEP
jgi:hypothetical protein